MLNNVKRVTHNGKPRSLLFYCLSACFGLVACRRIVLVSMSLLTTTSFPDIAAVFSKLT